MNKFENIFLSSRLRNNIIIFAVAFSLAIVMIKMYTIRKNDEFLKSQGEARSIRLVKNNVLRGNILDRNHQLLATSATVFHVSINPKKFSTNNSKLYQLSTYLGSSVDSLKQKIQKNKDKNFLYLAKNLKPELAELISSLGIDNLEMHKSFKRFYPFKESFSQLIGLTDTEDKGLEGIELTFNDYLSGYASSKRIIKDNYGRQIEILDPENELKRNNDLVLSIDTNIQQYAYETIKKSVEYYGAKHANTVILDITTGEIIALVNYPSFNPNKRDFFNTNNVKNKAIVDSFEPGSVLKPFSLANLLLNGRSLNETIETHPGYFSLNNFRISDLKNHGNISLKDVIRLSSNVGIAKMSLDTPKNSLKKTLSLFGFGDSTYIEHNYESTGQLNFSNEHSDIETASLSYGYGISVTSLQLARAYAALGSGGVLKPITFLKRLNPNLDGDRIIDADMSASILKVLHEAVENGTGKAAKVKNVSVAGKTGTARKITKDGYDKTKHYASFVGIFPVENPKFCIVVVFDEPTLHGYTGGKVAAPVFSKLANFTYQNYR